ncbi:integrase, catalytic region, zinc finger, CCHC-type containing protein [Tanacetum coccineum]
MLAMGRYAKWQSRFLRYIDTRPNGDALRKCILEGPYQPTTVTIPTVPATENSSAEIEDEIYSTVDACKTTHEMWIAIERLQQVSSTTSTRMVKVCDNCQQQHDLDTVSYHKLFDVLKQYQKEVNKIRVERIVKNTNQSALVAAAQQYPDPYYQAPKFHKSFAPSSKQASSTISNASTKFKGKEIAKPITPPSESASEEDMTVVGARETKGIKVGQQTGIQCFNCKEFGHFAKECRKPKRVKDYTYHKEKMLLCKKAEKGVPLQAEQADWLEDTNEEIDEQELESHYSFMAKIQEVPNADSRTDTEPLEQVHNDAEYNVFANARQHSEQSESLVTHVLNGKNGMIVNVTSDSRPICS